uniref:DUF5688 family protein n=1 Tax=Acetatifactor sp. TaxID=1872090 RepID=UPI004057B0C0
MRIKEFAEAVREELETRTGRLVEVREVLKNNGVILHGINIIEADVNVTPTIYVEPFLKDFEAGARLEEIAERILEIYQRDKVSHHLDMSWFKDLEQVRGKVIYKLVNYEANKGMLEQVPYEKVLDFAKVYCVTVDTEEFGHGTILIYSNHLEFWGITAEELGKVADENTPKLFPAETKWMGDMLKELGFDGDTEIENGLEQMKNACPMYVMSNAHRVFGAATMCYPDAVKSFAEEVEKDVLIIPSSTHEIIMIPMVADTDIMQIREMVHEVNRTQVADEEILSDSVYIYSRETDSLSIA